MRIYTDRNDVGVNAISRLPDGTPVDGHVYQVIAGAGILNISFQRGGVVDHGVNGITNEALLAILIHRTIMLNAKFPCYENEQAITCMSQALSMLESRTQGRVARGVEGKEIR